MAEQDTTLLIGLFTGAFITLISVAIGMWINRK